MTKIGMPAQQDWVCQIPIMQQSVLFSAIRAPDGIHKHHPVKVLVRWYRRCVLLSAFDGCALTDPFAPGGGSFTGPFTDVHSRQILGVNIASMGGKWAAFNKMQEVYLNHVDELPHHFQLHFMHAAQIVGVHHPKNNIRLWWSNFYRVIVNDAHLHTESEDEMNLRLGDNQFNWEVRNMRGG